MTLMLRPGRCSLTTVVVMLAIPLMSSQVPGQPANNKQAATTLWATGDSLMPAWGFFPLRQAYGGTKPLGRWAAWCAAGLCGKPGMRLKGLAPLRRSRETMSGESCMRHAAWKRGVVFRSAYCG